ncbi:DUF3035 domain-containing protein [uncultured Sphingomonas sp.]|uniref:DUF3035 domain-containing protein n=1 Tax=uncultured Sphingomonas sp. TaxID=158754 RepID=UPI0035C975A4
MRKLGLAAGIVAATLVSGCGHRGFSRTRSGPDELAVVRQQPLVIPPDFALQPPQPGAAATGSNNASAQALDALFGGAAARSAGERGVVDTAGGDQADPGIRSGAGDPGTTVVDKASTTRDIVAAPEGNGRDAGATAK